MDIDQKMATNEGTEKSATGGASESVPRNSIVDAFVFSTVFPGNYRTTLRELSELHKKQELNKNDMLKLKLLAVVLCEQLLGQLSVDTDKVVMLMREYGNKR